MLHSPGNAAIRGRNKSTLTFASFNKSYMPCETILLRRGVHPTESGRVRAGGLNCLSVRPSDLLSVVWQFVSSVTTVRMYLYKHSVAVRPGQRYTLATAQ